MNPLTNYINSLYNLLLGEVPNEDETLIKIHTRYLERLGDLSFPICTKNWYHLIGKTKSNASEFIFKHKLDIEDPNEALEYIKTIIQNPKIRQYNIQNVSVQLYFEKTPLFTYGIQQVLLKTSEYGALPFLQNPMIVTVLSKTQESNEDNFDLTSLRLLLLKDFIERLLKLTTASDCASKPSQTVSLSYNSGSVDQIHPTVLCGPVINEKGAKNSTHRAIDLFNKRSTDMWLMAQHRYRMNIKSGVESNEYFSNLGRASVTIELLSNKPQKALKVTPNDLSSANKGPAFIFYNCARLSTLVKEFEARVSKGSYPALTDIKKIDFGLLKQPEEWELLYVYILQYPLVVRNCIRSIEKGIVNPQYLITFLSNLSSLFSVYYQRIRILTEPRDHLIAIIHARIYLLKALQYVFHNALALLKINPIREM